MGRQQRQLAVFYHVFLVAKVQRQNIGKGSLRSETIAPARRLFSMFVTQASRTCPSGSDPGGQHYDIATSMRVNSVPQIIRRSAGYLIARPYLCRLRS